MKAREKIANEINRIELISKITPDDIWVDRVNDFYDRYPKYKDIKGDAVYFILQSIRTKHKPVKVHQFTNGSLWFVGDIMTAKNAPIASIGDWACIETWEKDLVKHSKIVDEIAWNF